jgi:hypothetical protein
MAIIRLSTTTRLAKRASVKYKNAANVYCRWAIQ